MIENRRVIRLVLLACFLLESTKAGDQDASRSPPSSLSEEPRRTVLSSDIYVKKHCENGNCKNSPSSEGHNSEDFRTSGVPVERSRRSTTGQLDFNFEKQTPWDISQKDMILANYFTGLNNQIVHNAFGAHGGYYQQPLLMHSSSLRRRMARDRKPFRDFHSVMHFGKRSTGSTGFSLASEDEEENDASDSKGTPSSEDAFDDSGHHPYDKLHLDEPLKVKDPSSPSHLLVKRSAELTPYNSLMHFGKRFDKFSPHNSLMHFGKRPQGYEELSPYNSLMHFGKRSQGYQELSPYNSLMHFGKRPQGYQELSPYNSLMHFGKRPQGYQELSPYNSLMHFGKRLEDLSHYNSSVNFMKRFDGISPYNSLLHFGKRFGEYEFVPSNTLMHFGKRQDGARPSHSVMHFGKRSVAEDALEDDSVDSEKGLDDIGNESRRQEKSKIVGTDSPITNLGSSLSALNPEQNFEKLESDESPRYPVVPFRPILNKGDSTTSEILRTIGTNANNLPLKFSDVLEIENAMVRIVNDNRQKGSYSGSDDMMNRSGEDVKNGISNSSTRSEKRFDYNGPHNSVMHFGKRFDSSSPYNSVMHFGKRFDSNSPYNSVMHFGKRFDRSSPYNSVMHFGKRFDSTLPYNSVMHFGKRFDSSSPYNSVMHFGKRFDSTLPYNSVMHFGKRFDSSSPYNSVMHFGKRFDSSSPYNSVMHFGKRFDSSSPYNSLMHFGKRFDNNSPYNSVMHFGKRFDGSSPYNSVMHFGKRFDSSLPYNSVMHFGKRFDNNSPYNSVMHFGKRFDSSSPYNSVMHFGKRFDSSSPYNSVMHFGKRFDNNSPYNSVMHFGKRFDSSSPYNSVMHFGKRFDSSSPYNSVMHFGKRFGESSPYNSVMHFGKRFDSSSPYNSVMHFGKRFDSSSPYNSVMHFGKRFDSSSPYNSVMHFGKRFDSSSPYNSVMHFGKRFDSSSPYNSVMHFGKRFDSSSPYNSVMHFGKRLGNSSPYNSLFHLEKRNMSSEAMEALSPSQFLEKKLKLNGPQNSLMHFGKRFDLSSPSNSLMHFGKRSGGGAPFNSVLHFGKRFFSTGPTNSLMHFGKRFDENVPSDSITELEKRFGPGGPQNSLMHFGKKFDETVPFNSVLHFGKRSEEKSETTLYNLVKNFDKKFDGNVPYNSVMHFGKRFELRPGNSLMHFGKKSSGNSPFNYVMHFGKRFGQSGPQNSLMHFGKRFGAEAPFNSVLHFGKRANENATSAFPAYHEKKYYKDAPFNTVMHFGRRSGDVSPSVSAVRLIKRSTLSKPYNSVMHFGKKFDYRGPYNSVMHFGKRSEQDDEPGHSLVLSGNRRENYEIPFGFKQKISGGTLNPEDVFSERLFDERALDPDTHHFDDDFSKNEHHPETDDSSTYSGSLSDNISDESERYHDNEPYDSLSPSDRLLFGAWDGPLNYGNDVDHSIPDLSRNQKKMILFGGKKTDERRSSEDGNSGENQFVYRKKRMASKDQSKTRRDAVGGDESKNAVEELATFPSEVKDFTIKTSSARGKNDKDAHVSDKSNFESSLRRRNKRNSGDPASEISTEKVENLGKRDTALAQENEAESSIKDMMKGDERFQSDPSQFSRVPQLRKLLTHNTNGPPEYLQQRSGPVSTSSGQPIKRFDRSYPTNERTAQQKPTDQVQSSSFRISAENGNVEFPRPSYFVKSDNREYVATNRGTSDPSNMGLYNKALGVMNGHEGGKRVEITNTKVVKGNPRFAAKIRVIDKRSLGTRRFSALPENIELPAEAYEVTEEHANRPKPEKDGSFWELNPTAYVSRNRNDMLSLPNNLQQENMMNEVDTTDPLLAVAANAFVGNDRYGNMDRYLGEYPVDPQEHLTIPLSLLPETKLRQVQKFRYNPENFLFSNILDNRIRPEVNSRSANCFHCGPYSRKIRSPLEEDGKHKAENMKPRNENDEAVFDLSKDQSHAVGYNEGGSLGNRQEHDTGDLSSSMEYGLGPNGMDFSFLSEPYSVNDNDIPKGNIDMITKGNHLEKRSVSRQQKVSSSSKENSSSASKSELLQENDPEMQKSAGFPASLGQNNLQTTPATENASIRHRTAPVVNESEQLSHKTEAEVKFTSPGGKAKRSSTSDAKPLKTKNKTTDESEFPGRYGPSADVSETSKSKDSHISVSDSNASTTDSSNPGIRNRRHTVKATSQQEESIASVRSYSSPNSEQPGDQVASSIDAKTSDGIPGGDTSGIDQFHMARTGKVQGKEGTRQHPSYSRMKRDVRQIFRERKRYWGSPFQGAKSMVYNPAWLASQLRRSSLPLELVRNSLPASHIRLAEKKEVPMNSFLHFG